MLKIYNDEKDRLCDIFDPSKKADPKHTTVLGNFIFLLLDKLPEVLRNYSGMMSPYLCLLARFASLGPEARLYLLRAEALGRLLRMFYGA